MDESGPYSFPDALRAKREHARMSREALADLIGRSADSVARWETGRNMPRRSTMVRVADALGVSVEDLGQ